MGIVETGVKTGFGVLVLRLEYDLEKKKKTHDDEEY